MPEFDTAAVRRCLKEGRLTDLFIEELGWDHHTTPLSVESESKDWTLQPIAYKRGLVVYRCAVPNGERLPEYGVRRKIEHQVAKSVREHIIVFTDEGATTQVWQWVKREAGKPAACREHPFHATQSGEALAQKLRAIAVSLDEEEATTLPGVLSGVKAAFDVERVTKRFYDQFKKEHAAFLGFVSGITDIGDREWYASVMLNRLMFVYFVQRKGFLDGDRNYLRNRLARCQKEHGKDKFYSFYREFLLRLFHEGLGGKDRNPELDELLGRVPYLNGGLFEQHEIESRNPDIQMPDEAFKQVFDYFDDYQWHLDERPLRADNEINPDVLGYIFEKYINQKQMGAYYTKEDITEYIGKNTVIPFLLDAARAKCKVAFENPGGPTVWDLLRDDPDRYIYPAVRHGMDIQLPDEIVVGINPPSLHKPVGKGPVKTLEFRKGWNRPAPPEFALPTETWREVVARRTRCEKIRAKLSSGEVLDVNDLITLNLDIRQFAQDAIENCEGPALLRAFWQSIEKITILDPTCGSGAFLFAALNILEPLYEACLVRMEAFVEDLERSGEKHRPEKFSDFRATLAHVAAHPNRAYFIFKSIILNNLYGVDIMEEAVEICKLRLFLKLAAQVDPKVSAQNFGIEPLPDIDFNIRAGNTLVGFATYEDVEKALTYKLDFDNALEKISVKAADLQQLFNAFRQRQVEGDGSVPAKDKAALRERLAALDDELNHYLAREYGVKPESDSYKKWLKSHQPFHWFVEFYAIMQAEGFDVIIGNPPFVEYGKVREVYSVRGYGTEPCGNLYAFILERSTALVATAGRLGLIAPIALISVKETSSARKLVCSRYSWNWFSNFAIRPAKLFEGVEQRLTIWLARAELSGRGGTFTTKYLQWYKAERPFLFAGLEYCLASDIYSDSSLSIPKVGNVVAHEIIRKTTQPTGTIGAGLVRHGSSQLFFHRTPGYWIRIMNFEPYFRSPTATRSIHHIRELAVKDDATANFIGSVVSSSLYFLWFFAVGNCRNLTLEDIRLFPIGTPVPELLERSTKLFAELMDDYQRNSVINKRGDTEFQEFDWGLSKPLVDEIDLALAGHYGLTAEELDYAIN